MVAEAVTKSKMVKYLLGNNKAEIIQNESIFKEITDMTMVVVGLIAAMAFQAAVSPPGGVWQEDTSSYKAGKSVMASTHPKLYKHFHSANSLAFASSLFVISLVSVRAPSQSFIFVGFIWYLTWLSMASIGVSYGASIIMTNPMETITVGRIVALVVSLSVVIFVMVSLYTYIQVLYPTWVFGCQD